MSEPRHGAAHPMPSWPQQLTLQKTQLFWEKMSCAEIFPLMWVCLLANELTNTAISRSLYAQ